MWYNTQLKAKPPRNYSSTGRHQFQSSLGKDIVNPRERLMNTQKRQKLRDLLIDRFAQKYNLGKNRILIEGEITRFLQQEKLNDVDLQRLDAKIKRLITQDITKKQLKKTLTENLNYNQPINEYDINNQNNLNISPEEENIYPTNYQPSMTPSLNQANNKANIRSNSQQANNTLRPLSSQTYIPQQKLNLYKDRTSYQKPEEELAQLEAELKAEEERELQEKGYYHPINYKYQLKKIDFKKYGNEWAAMAAYDKKLYEQQLLDERIRTTQQKKRTKYDLDEQVKEKIKKEYEDELKEKEYDKIFKEHQKELDKIEKEKEKKIKEQYLREKESRQAQLKDNYVRRRIDELKERKFDKKVIRTILTEMENEKKQNAEQKRKRNFELNKALKENEENRKNLKLIQEKQREEDLQFLEEQKKMDIRKEQQREYLLNKIKNKFNNAYSQEAENKVKQIQIDQEEEDKKMIHYMNEKCRLADEKEMKEKIKRQKEKTELKKYYDMQVEERKKDEQFEKVLDGEQARIWKKDCEKYNEDEKRIAKIIWDKNVRNLNTIKKQIQEKKEKEKKNTEMTPIEFSINREKLMKVQEALG
jgi:hypothetical protein